jgi:hypothetical protein
MKPALCLIINDRSSGQPRRLSADGAPWSANTTLPSVCSTNVASLARMKCRALSRDETLAGYLRIDWFRRTHVFLAAHGELSMIPRPWVSDMIAPRTFAADRWHFTCDSTARVHKDRTDQFVRSTRCELSDVSVRHCTITSDATAWPPELIIWRK